MEIGPKKYTSQKEVPSSTPVNFGASFFITSLSQVLGFQLLFGWFL